MTYLKKPLAGFMAGAVLTSLVVAGSVEARELSFASGATPNSIGSKSIDVFSNALEERSGGDLSVKAYMQSLLSFLETPSGLRDGMADFGAVLTPYFQTEFPSTIMLTELTMLLELDDTSAREATFAFGGAISEYVFNNCPECLEEYSNNNQVFLGISGSTPYTLICNKPVTTMEELKGKRVRVGGPQWARWAESMGASPVSMAVNEVYEGLGQGVLDCTAHNLPDLTNFNFIEVTSDVTLGVPGGIFGGIATHMHADAWKNLSVEHRKDVLYASAALAAEIARLYVKEHEENRELIREMDDIAVHDAGDELKAATRSFIENDVATIAERYQENHDLARSGEMIAGFRDRLSHWLELVQDVETGEELQQLYWDEVFSKVDVNQYGM
ncbi:TRAP-type C4-dicarboxylate transport system, substrate-binding protein [Marinobacter daqiaonensis]|uniref:TRAP-type C4-dicarboxylate transport system, substrate-binding protein n=1 Tax=Marinobacter daqiaonensis TaxID=650891 RepID=A0A1I6IMU5_9GAMM|nr:C4-dicarboxylate TRAP transporter substrate-binding protein [Marinobacter daqiaonensis]SFR68038.1 TRAP-type C4-dicarboxylate transport system, substrate-binding protein [Marinobacter daqiaonensis]